jgi:signal transduction histidine kinase
MALELGRDKHEIERDIAELDALVDEILLASRLDAVPTLETSEPVDLLALAAEEAARYGARLLRRMLRNLLENARRHGSPPITIAVRKREIEVCDAGPGVAPADRERIFEPFYQRARGSGLGLSIVRQIARRHGGEVRCEGNCFVVTLRVT